MVANAADMPVVVPSRLVETRGDRAAMAVAKNAEKEKQVSEERIPTSEKLAQALEAAGAPPEMIIAARGKHYDDYESDLMTPIRQLAADAMKHGLTTIAERAMNGEFDGTKEEAEAWGKSAEGKATFAEFGGSSNGQGKPWNQVKRDLGWA